MTTIRIGIILALLALCQPATAADDGAAELQQLFENFKTAYADGQYAVALDWIEKLIAAKEQQFGADSPELVISLTNLAALEFELKNWEAASRVSRRALDIVNRQSGDQTDREIPLLVTRARAELALGNEGVARDLLYDALKINSKRKPVDRWREAELYAVLVEVAKQTKDVGAGNRACDDSLRSRGEVFGGDLPEMLPHIEECARWYRYASQFEKERRVSKRAVAIIENHIGPNDWRLSIPLRRIAQTYTISRTNPGKAEEALLRAGKLDFDDSAFAALEQAKIETDLGDYYLVFVKPEIATGHYRNAWKSLADHPEIGTEFANHYFEEPLRLHMPIPSRPAKARGGNYFTDGYVVLGYTVAESGLLENVEVIESQPPQMNENQFFMAARKARFRPRIVDGEPIRTPDQMFRMVFEPN